MNQTKRIFALFLALLLTAGLFGCSKPKEEPTEPAATAAPTATGYTTAPSDADVKNYSRDAVAIELGDVKITAGEIEDSYNMYMNMLLTYYGSTPSDDASIREYREMAVTELIRFHVPEWKAAQMGITLTPEEEAEIVEAVQHGMEDARNELICTYAAYYTDAEDVTRVEDLTQEQLDIVMTQINSELTEYFGEGYTLDRYFEEEYDLEAEHETHRMEKLEEKLRASMQETQKVTEEQVNAWYEQELEEQKLSFDEDPTVYRDHYQNALTGDTTVPVLYRPEDFIRVQVIAVSPEAERDLMIDTNRSEMAKLEAEYGELALNEKDPERQAEIAKSYAALKEENEKMEKTYLGDARKAIDAAYEALKNGATFASQMESANKDGALDWMLFEDDSDATYAEVFRVANALKVGEYSAPFVVNDTYFIVLRMEDPTPGVIARAEIEDAIVKAATEEAQNDAWNELYNEWETEAETAAVRHEETYAAIGYLSND